MKKYYWFPYCWLLLFAACQSPSEEKNTSEEFIIQDGFEVEIAAGDELLESPVVIDFDLKGRIWAVEMTGYMRDVDGSDEKLPDGRISILEDTNGDGVMDKKKVFLDELVLPRAIAFINDGLLYAEPPNLWWVPIGENDEAGEKQLIDSLYANGGNVEHMPNGLLYNLDNWIYSSKSDRRYRYRNGKWEVEATYFKGQWGISNDDDGRLYYNNNSNPIYGDLIQSNQLQGNPYLRNRHLERKNLAKTRGLNPYKATYVNRGYSKGVLDETGKLRNFTSACSPLIYRGDQFSADYYDNAFVCGPEANLVKRYHINRENGVITADTTLQKQEFLVSKEEVFRPVNLHNGPDGAMYVVDMHRVVIQHRAFMTSYLKDLIIKSGMDKIPNGGRILRVTEKANAKETLGDYSNLKPTDWVALLQSPNPWKRITAQKTLIGKDAKNLTTAIEKIAQAEEIPLGQMHALWTLEGLGTLTYKLLIQIGTTTKNPQVLSQVILISKKILNENNVAHFLPVFEKALAGEAYDPKLQLAHTLGSFKNPATEKIWLALANTFAEDKIMSEALVSSTYERENFFANKIAKDLKNSQLDSMMMATLENKKEDKKHELKISMKDHSDDRTRGFELFITHCASCHGMDAKGIENLAPSIYESEYANGPVEHLGLILLNGLKGPITIHGKKYEGAAVMPGLRDNPAITDEAIRDIIIFIKNSFSSKNQKRPSKKLIPELREATKDRKDLFTEAELHAWPIEKK